MNYSDLLQKAGCKEVHRCRCNGILKITYRGTGDRNTWEVIVKPERDYFKISYYGIRKVVGRMEELQNGLITAGIYEPEQAGI